MNAELDSGSYFLVIKLRRGQEVKIGSLGVFHFPAGYYVYTGSAMKKLTWTRCTTPAQAKQETLVAY